MPTKSEIQSRLVAARAEISRLRGLNSDLILAQSKRENTKPLRSMRALSTGDASAVVKGRDQLRKRVSEQLTRIDSLSATLADSEYSREDLSQEVLSQSRRIQELSNDLAVAASDSNALREKVAAQLGRLEDLSSKLAEATAARGKLSQEVSSQFGRIEALSASLLTATEERDSALKAKDGLSDRLSHQPDAVELSRLRSENDRLLRELEAK